MRGADSSWVTVISSHLIAMLPVPFQDAMAAAASEGLGRQIAPQSVELHAHCNAHTFQELSQELEQALLTHDSLCVSAALPARSAPGPSSPYWALTKPVNINERTHQPKALAAQPTRTPRTWLSAKLLTAGPSLSAMQSRGGRSEHHSKHAALCERAQKQRRRGHHI